MDIRALRRSDPKSYASARIHPGGNISSIVWNFGSIRWNFISIEWKISSGIYMSDKRSPVARLPSPRRKAAEVMAERSAVAFCPLSMLPARFFSGMIPTVANSVDFAVFNDVS